MRWFLLKTTVRASAWHENRPSKCTSLIIIRRQRRRRRRAASGWRVGKWKKNRCRGALNVIIIWQEDKCEIGEEWYGRFLTCSPRNVFANKFPPGHLPCTLAHSHHTSSLPSPFCNVCAPAECTLAFVVCVCVLTYDMYIYILSIGLRAYSLISNHRVSTV